jgi:hypothetical protein
MSEFPSNHPAFSPEQLALFRTNAQTFATISAMAESARPQNLSENDADYSPIDKLFHTSNYMQWSLFLKQAESSEASENHDQLIVWTMLKDRTHKDEPISISSYVDEVPSEYSRLMTDEFIGRVIVGDPAVRIGYEYTILGLETDVDEDIIAITKQQVITTDEQNSIDRSLQAHTLKTLDAVLRNAELKEREFLLAQRESLMARTDKYFGIEQHLGHAVLLNVQGAHDFQVLMERARTESKRQSHDH